ncbi:MAG: hypothetical protein IIX84_00190 [Oscillospiraceae bacterium]|nr:hypothetical protein [Oscillospiraceae bacterium]
MEANEKNRLQERNAVRTLLFALLIGAAGGVIRGIQLLDFNERNFPSASGGIHVVLWCVLSFELIAAAVAWFCLRKKELCGRKGRESVREYLLPKVSMIVFALCAAVRLAMSYKPFSAWGIILGLLCFAIAASVPVAVSSLGKPSVSDSERLISLLPVGAMVAVIIELYRSVAKTPAASFYATDVFAVVVLVLLFFAAAGDVNGKTGPKKIIITAFAFVEIGTTAFLGRVISVVSALVGGAGASCIITAEFFEGLLALGGIFFAFAAVSAVGRRGNRILETETEADAESAAAEETK